MRLLEFIRSSDFTFETFAERIDESENIVRKWAYRQRQPSLPNALKIEAASRGLVTPSDLLLDAESIAVASANGTSADEG